MNSKHCVCGSEKAYHDCCEPLHLGKKQAQTAEQLMRSRYAAFCCGKSNPAMVDYLIDTHHSSQHKPYEREGILETMQQLQWLGLKIVSTEAGQADDAQGIVEFIASYQDAAGEKSQHHERSRFLKENDRWFYVDGDILPCPVGGDLRE